MKPLTVYDYLALARGRLFEQIRPLSPAQYAREFPIGLGTLGATLTHLMISEWYYVQRMLGRITPPYSEWPIRAEDPPPFAVLETEWSRQATETRAALRTVRDWDAPIEYQVRADDGRAMIVTASASGLFMQLALHEAHHRAQVMNMLRHLGVVAEDLDYNAMMFERREAL